MKKNIVNRCIKTAVAAALTVSTLMTGISASATVGFLKNSNDSTSFVLDQLSEDNSVLNDMVAYTDADGDTYVYITEVNILNQVLCYKEIEDDDGYVSGYELVDLYPDDAKYGIPAYSHGGSGSPDMHGSECTKTLEIVGDKLYVVARETALTDPLSVRVYQLVATETNTTASAENPVLTAKAWPRVNQRAVSDFVVTNNKIFISCSDTAASSLSACKDAGINQIFCNMPIPTTVTEQPENVDADANTDGGGGAGRFTAAYVLSGGKNTGDDNTIVANSRTGFKPTYNNGYLYIAGVAIRAGSATNEYIGTPMVWQVKPWAGSTIGEVKKIAVGVEFKANSMNGTTYGDRRGRSLYAKDITVANNGVYAAFATGAYGLGDGYRYFIAGVDANDPSSFDTANVSTLNDVTGVTVQESGIAVRPMNLATDGRYIIWGSHSRNGGIYDTVGGVNLYGAQKFIVPGMVNQKVFAHNGRIYSFTTRKNSNNTYGKLYSMGYETFTDENVTTLNSKVVNNDSKTEGYRDGEISKNLLKEVLRLPINLSAAGISATSVDKQDLDNTYYKTITAFKAVDCFGGTARMLKCGTTAIKHTYTVNMPSGATRELYANIDTRGHNLKYSVKLDDAVIVENGEIENCSFGIPVLVKMADINLTKGVNTLEITVEGCHKDGNNETLDCVKVGGFAIGYSGVGDDEGVSFGNTEIDDDKAKVWCSSVSATRSGKIFYGFYGDEDRFLGVSDIVDFTIPGSDGEVDSTVAEIPYSVPEGTKTVKRFIWNGLSTSDALMPFTDAEVKTN